MTDHAVDDQSRSTRARLAALVEKFHWVHTSLGLLGNTCFFVGSVLFLWESTKLPGVWLFIIGSLGMLLGSIGDEAAKWDGDD